MVATLALGSPVYSALAVEPGEVPATGLPAQKISRQAGSGTISSRMALPDDGPRYDRMAEGPGALQFHAAVAFRVK